MKGGLTPAGFDRVPILHHGDYVVPRERWEELRAMVKSECEHLWEAVNGPDDDDGNGHSYARCKLCGDSPSESNDFSFENLAKSIRVKEVRDGRLIIGGPALALYHETGTRVGGESRTVIGLTVDQIIKLRDFYISQTGKDPAQL